MSTSNLFIYFIFYIYIYININRIQCLTTTGFEEENLFDENQFL